MMLHYRLGEARSNVPAHHGVQLNRAETARSTPQSTPQSTPRSTSKGAEADGWTIPVLLTSAEKGDGMEDLMDRLGHHGEWLEASGELERRQRARLEERVRDAVLQRLLALTWQESEGRDILEESLDGLRTGETTPYEVADRIVRAVGG